MSIVSSKNQDSWNPIVGVFFGAFILYIAQFFISLLLVPVVLIVSPFLKLHSRMAINNWLNNSTTAQFILVLFSEIIAVAAVIYYLKNKNNLRKIGLKRPKLIDPLYGVLMFVPYIITYLIGLQIVLALDKNLNVNQKQQIGFNNVHGETQLILTFISLVILPPIAEEIVFRGLIYTSLRRLVKFWPAAIITSLLFAAGHLLEGGSSGPLYVAAIDTFILSMYLILLRVKTQRLYASMTLHGLKNAIAFASLFILHVH